MRRLPISIAVGITLLLCTSPVLRGDADHGAAAERAYAYGSGPRHRLVAYRDQNPAGGPAGTADPDARRPGVVILHGGFWFGDQPAGWNLGAQRIADSGAVVFDVDYRRNVDAAWPAQRSDVLRALRWIRGRADIFGVDPDRLVLLGSSAGGHLATAVGTYGAGRQRVAGVVGLSPVADPYR
ncbi:MAG: alpha/beta hydrolase, partial [Streptomyces sp.]